MLVIPSHSNGTAQPILSSSAVQVKHKECSSEVEGDSLYGLEGEIITVSYLSTNRHQASILMEGRWCTPGVCLKGRVLFSIVGQPLGQSEEEVGTLKSDQNWIRK